MLNSQHFKSYRFTTAKPHAACRHYQTQYGAHMPVMASRWVEWRELHGGEPCRVWLNHSGTAHSGSSGWFSTPGHPARFLQTNICFQTEQNKVSLPLLCTLTCFHFPLLDLWTDHSSLLRLGTDICSCCHRFLLFLFFSSLVLVMNAKNWERTAKTFSQPDYLNHLSGGKTQSEPN